MATCSHLDRVEIVEPEGEVGGLRGVPEDRRQWVHLRMCETCGKIGCCDSSPNRHATRHAREDDHPVLRSVEPGEAWSWCVVDEVMFTLRTAEPG